MVQLRRLALLSLIATAIALLVVGARRGWFQTPTIDHVGNLASSIGSSLPFEARLSGGFAPPAYRTVRRSDSSGSLPPDARIAIANLEKQTVLNPSPRAFADLAVAYLVQGDVDRSVGLLEASASLLDDSRTWNDLSAAYLVKADRVTTHRIEYYARSLEAAKKSLQRSSSSEARFNRALALEGLTPFIGPTDPWTDVLAGERDERWISRGREHIQGGRVEPAPDDVSSSWAGTKPRLLDALQARDKSFVEETTLRFPEAALELFERELLVEWAAGSVAALEQAGMLGSALELTTGDSIPLTEVRLIRSTGDRLKAAHTAYAEGVSRLDADDLAGASSSLTKARKDFARTRSPYAAWASAQQATIAFQQRRLGDADHQLEIVERFARAGHHRTLLGRTLWLRGLVYSKQWRLNEALNAFRAATALFEESRQIEHAVSLYGYLADVLRTLGENHESWEYIGRTLEGLTRVRKPLRRYLFLYNASLFASSQDLLEPALLFQNAALREAQRVGQGPAMEALTQRASILVRRGETSRANADLREVRRLIELEPNENRKRWARAEYAMVAASASPGQPLVAVDGLTQAIDFFSHAEPSMVPRLQLGLGRAHLVAGQVDAAEESLRRGIEWLEMQQARLDDEALKISYFDEAWNLFPEMIDLQLRRRHDDAKAFEFAERSRARSLLAASTNQAARPVPEMPAIQAALPDGVVLLYFATLADRLQIWIISRSSASHADRDIGHSDLARLISQHRDAIAVGRDDRTTSEQLYDWLIEPAVNVLKDDATW